MAGSSNRILTTHVGSLPRPSELIEFISAKTNAEIIDETAFEKCLAQAVSDIVKKQVELGIDIVNDGEFSKPSFLFQAARYLIEGKVPPQAGNDHPTSTPMGVVATADGFINIGVGGDGQWRAFCKAIGRPELAVHPDYAKGADRTRNRPQIKALIAPIFSTRTSAEWLEQLEAEGVPAGPIYKVDEVFADPQVKHLSVAVSVKDAERGDVRVVGQPIVMSRTPASVVSGVPEQGEHTQDILKEFGYSDTEIAQLRDRKIV